jgi:hypothetical protein
MEPGFNELSNPSVSLIPEWCRRLTNIFRQIGHIGSDDAPIPIHDSLSIVRSFATSVGCISPHTHTLGRLSPIVHALAPPEDRRMVSSDCAGTENVGDAATSWQTLSTMTSWVAQQAEHLSR